MLAHPDFSKPFILSTDASTDGLGAVLSQVAAGEKRARPIAFASKTLNKAQRNYPAHRLEFLALKWAVCEKFSHWLKGHTFTAWTDNNPLVHILTKPKLDAVEQRWVSKLAAYDFDVKYVPGPRNVVADALSREPFVGKRISERLVCEPYECLLEESEALSGGDVQEAFRSSTIRQAAQKTLQMDTCSLPVETTSPACSMSGSEVSALLDCHNEWDTVTRMRSMVLVDHVQTVMSIGQDVLPSISKNDLRDKQRDDPELARVLFYVERRRRPSRRERPNESVTALRLMKQWDKLVVEDGMLYRVSRDPVSRKKRNQFVVPMSLRDDALRGCHDDAGHQGQDRTLSLVKRRFYWSSMERDVRNHVKCCVRCVMGKTTEPEGRAPLESIRTTAPMELVCIDFWSAEDSKNRPVDVLVVTDHFTRLSHAFYCPDQTAKQVARRLWDNFFCYYGFPERIHSDQGANFESELIAALLQVSGVKKSHTTAYHPMGNGSAERFNRTLGNMLRTLPPRSKQAWPQMLHTLTFMYNSTTHETTGFPPFYLMFGRVPRLPVDVLFKSALRDDSEVAFPQYVEELRRDLREAMILAEKHAGAEQRRQAALYNRRVKGVEIEPGDRVLLANKGERGRRKLADRWGDVVYTVVNSNPQTHTFEIRDPMSGQSKIVHRNLLLCVNFLPVLPEADDSGSFVSSCALEESATVDFSIERLAWSDVASLGSCNLDVASLQLTKSDSGLDNVARVQDWVSHIPMATADRVPAVMFAAPDLSAQVPDSATPAPVSASPAPDSAAPDSGALSPYPGAPFNGSCYPGGHDGISSGTLQASPSGRRRTRAGRVVRPVNRLIQTMNGQTLHT